MLGGIVTPARRSPLRTGRDGGDLADQIAGVIAPTGRDLHDAGPPETLVAAATVTLTLAAGAALMAFPLKRPPRGDGRSA